MKIKSYVFLALAQTMGGVNIVCAKYLLTTVPVSLLLAVRFLGATLMLLLLHYMFSVVGIKKSIFSLNQYDWLFLLLAAISAGAVFNLLMLWGLHYTDATSAGIITSALPAIIAILTWLILRECLSSKKIVCIFFATAGLFIVSTQKVSDISVHYSLKGNLIILLALLPEACYYIITKVRPNPLPVFLVAALINATNTLLLLPALFFYHYQWTILTISDWLALIALVGSSALFYVFWQIGSRGIDSSMTALSTALMPIATLIIAWVCLKERILLGQCLGMLLVIASIFFYAAPWKIRKYKEKIRVNYEFDKT